MLDIANKDLPILVADDFDVMRNIAKCALCDLGFHNVTLACDGVDALERLQNEEIGLIVADWNMPRMSGMELLERVRSRAELKKIPFLLVTVESQTDCIPQAVKAGAAGFIVKPFSKETLRDKIDAILGR